MQTDLLNTRSAKTKVVIDTTVLGQTKTGTAVYVKNLIEAIKSIHPEDIDVIPIQGPIPKRQTKKFGRPLNLAKQLYWLHVALPRFLKKNKIDLLHMPAMTAPFHSPCPVVVTVHDAHFITNPHARDIAWLTYFRIAVKISASRATLILTDSSTAASAIEKHLKIDRFRLRIAYLGITPRQAMPDDGNFGLEYAPYLLYTGATILHKNVHMLVEAFALLVQKTSFSQYKLIMAGVPSDGHDLVLDAISRNHLEEKVLFLGFVPDSKLAALYANAALFVFPSKAEGFGMPPLEAMSYGTPVAASRASCIPEILADAADYFDPDDPFSIESAIENLMSDKNHYRQRIENGRARSALFTWKDCATKTLNVYREAIAGQ